jgi:outer membrane protein assembly factor BamB
LVALNRDSGEKQWEVVLDEKITYSNYRDDNGHRVSSTPVVGPEGVIVYSFHEGLLAYDHNGHFKWKARLKPQVTNFCPATSPVLHRGNVYLCLDESVPRGASQDVQLDPKLYAFNASTGEPIWATERPDSGRGYGTPIVWKNSHDDGTTTEELLVNGAGRLAAYSLDDGELNWWVSGLPRAAHTSPIVGKDRLFVSATSALGISDSGYHGPSWEEFLEFDTDEDGLVDPEDLPEEIGLASRPELPNDTPAYRVFAFKSLGKWFDKNKDGLFSKDEYDAVVKFWEGFSRPALLALQPQGQGDLTEHAINWKVTRGIPEVPSMLFYEDHLYSVKDGGILTCYDAETGNPVYKKRLGAGGLYTASPVAGDGRIYFCSAQGAVTVVKAGKTFEVLSQTRLDEKVHGTPALEGKRLYLRTLDHVHAFEGP